MIETPGHKVREVRNFLEKARSADSEDDLCEVVDDAIQVLSTLVRDVMKPDLVRTFTIELLPGAKIDRIGFDEKPCDILDFKGGSSLTGAKQNLLRQAVAALLNSTHPDVGYPLTTAQVISSVDTALSSDDRSTILGLASDLDAKNNLGCPL